MKNPTEIKTPKPSENTAKARKEWQQPALVSFFVKEKTEHFRFPFEWKVY